MKGLFATLAAPCSIGLAAAALAQAPQAVVQATNSGASASAARPAVSSENGSYDLGLLLGNQIANNGLGGSLSRQALQRGINDALAGKIVSGEQRDDAQQFMRASRQALADKNTHQAHEFLAKNIRQAGIKTLPSGLQYRVLEAGDAKAPPLVPTDIVNLRYRAELADGTVLDRSESHAQPPVFRVDSVIPAWRDALLAMHPGDKWQIYVPPEMGYGANSPPPLPPGALIVYQLDLLAVDSKPHVMPAQPAASSGAPAAGTH
ncbi:MAG TPA: FKBP-type peptidyl-prolyl cis-trans isomerase [Steroidobacteraceae bacterium]|jgi:FKBP-type peptidyl-prolyl cis-trans isomerase